MARKRAVVLTGAIFLLCAPLFCFLAFQPPRLVVRNSFELPGILNWRTAKLGDWDGDGRPDLFLVHNNQLLVVDTEGNVMLNQLTNPNRIIESGGRNLLLCLIQDVDGDGKEEAVVTWRKDTQLHIEVLRHDFYVMHRFLAEGSAYTFPSGQTSLSEVVAKKLVDLDQDGRRELLVAINSGYALKPRGVYCFDFDSGKLRWTFPIAPTVTDIEVLDVDGDGKLDVVFGSDAVDNGNQEADGTDDGHCYFYAVSHEGRLIWRKELGNWYTRCFPVVADLDGDGAKEVLACLWSDHEYRLRKNQPEVGQVLRLDDRGTIQQNYDAGARIQSCVAVDVEGDGRSEVVATDRLGNVHLLNPDLTLRRKKNLVSLKYNWADLKFAGLTGSYRKRRLVFSSYQMENVSGKNQGNFKESPNIRHVHDDLVLVVDPALDPVANFLAADVWKSDGVSSVKVLGQNRNGHLEIAVLGKDCPRPGVEGRVAAVTPWLGGTMSSASLEMFRMPERC